MSTPLLKKRIKSKSKTKIGFVGLSMSFAILRISKLKHFGNIGGSLAHNYRDRETHNADSDLSVMNEHSLENSDAVKNAITARLPEKRRSDAVLCIEHLITASPEWEGWGTDQEQDFFERSRAWLEQKYGKDNVIATTIHRDETTPHLVAYVVPLDESTGRLNAKKWLGGKKLLSEMQTDFAKNVEEFGLDRGVEGSKSRHTSIKEYYAKVNEAENKPAINFEMPNFPKSELFESKEKYAERVVDVVVESIFEQIKEEWDSMSILSNEFKTARKELSEAKETLLDTRQKLSEAKETLSNVLERAKPYLEIIEGMQSVYELKTLNERMLETKRMLNDEKERKLQQIQQQRLQDAIYEAAKRERELNERRAEVRAENDMKWSATFENLTERQKEIYSSFTSQISEVFGNDSYRIKELRDQVAADPFCLDRRVHVSKEKTNIEKTNDVERVRERERDNGMDFEM